MDTFKVGMLGLVLLFAGPLVSCKRLAPETEPPLPTMSPTYTITSTSVPIEPINTLPPTETATATSSPTVLYTVALTFSPTPTEGPGVNVIIRNNTPTAINLYRHGLSSEIHFLGWLESKYYGIYRFPSLGEWKITYCERENNGNDKNCQWKNINFKEAEKEYAVP